MAEYQLKTGELGKKAVNDYKKVEGIFTGAYHKIEDGVVGTYKKIENAFVDRFLEEK